MKLGLKYIIGSEWMKLVLYFKISIYSSINNINIIFSIGPGILVALCSSQTLGFNYNYLLQDQNHAPDISDVSAAVSAERGSLDQLVLPLRSYSMIRPGLARLYPLRLYCRPPGHCQYDYLDLIF